MGTQASNWTLVDLRHANLTRQAEWCRGQMPDLSYRSNELAGETGEACNIVKKLERERLGWAGSRATVDNLGDELADVVICADLVAATAGIDLYAAVERKFNVTSTKMGHTTVLAPYPELASTRWPDLRLTEVNSLLADANARQKLVAKASANHDDDVQTAVVAAEWLTQQKLTCPRCQKATPRGRMTKDGVCKPCWDEREEHRGLIERRFLLAAVTLAYTALALVIFLPSHL